MPVTLSPVFSQFSTSVFPSSQYRPCLFLTCLTCLLLCCFVCLFVLFCLGYLFGWLHLLVSWFPSTRLFQPWIYSLNGLSKMNCLGTLTRITVFGITFICCCKLSLCSTEVPINSTSVCVLHLGPVLTFAFCDFCSLLWKNEKLQGSVEKQGCGFRGSFSPVNYGCTFEWWDAPCCAGALPDLAAVCRLSDTESYEPCHRWKAGSDAPAVGWQGKQWAAL